jgi:hypothetical protein
MPPRCPEMAATPSSSNAEESTTAGWLLTRHINQSLHKMTFASEKNMKDLYSMRKIKRQKLAELPTAEAETLAPPSPDEEPWISPTTDETSLEFQVTRDDLSPEEKGKICHDELEKAQNEWIRVCRIYFKTCMIARGQM